eukprot:TRINITY_DN3101_c0_g1_i1.p1 TRINITY_DN3101_c0_g1~~TRINITY_DN3101_c0_g1_i1.p1  ORF type:complete len:321 (+),score=74.71 TRINITY_DN3101_c0_g1_i1:1333-2295(+)
MGAMFGDDRVVTVEKDPQGPHPVGPKTEVAVVKGKPVEVPREVGPWGPPPQGEVVGFWGPPVGAYSEEYAGTCYDLNDHYSMPRTLCGVFVRSPVEAGINAVAFFVCLGLQVHDVAVGGWDGVDWWTAPFKLIHFFFHVGVHIWANFSDGAGFDANKTIRAVNGAVFGIARYVVLFVYAWRMGGPYHLWFVLQAALFAALLIGKTQILGETIKTAYCALALALAMLHESTCSWAAYGVLAGLLLQLAGTGRFWLTGYTGGWYAKWWLRTDDRVAVPYHVLSDMGNALILLCAAYTPGVPPGGVDRALWTHAGVFPQCGMW